MVIPLQSSILLHDSFPLSNSSKLCFNEERKEKLCHIEKGGRYMGSHHAIDQIGQISALVPPPPPQVYDDDGRTLGNKGYVVGEVRENAFD